MDIVLGIICILSFILWTIFMILNEKFYELSLSETELITPNYRKWRLYFRLELISFSIMICCLSLVIVRSL